MVMMWEQLHKDRLPQVIVQIMFTGCIFKSLSSEGVMKQNKNFFTCSLLKKHFVVHIKLMPSEKKQEVLSLD